MKIADFCKQDTGGQSYKLVTAINRFTPHQARSLRLRPDYIDFPVDIQWGKWTAGVTKRWCRQWVAEADIVHAHGLYGNVAGCWGTPNPRARWLMHQHGRPGYLWQEWKEEDKRRNALRVVSTLNLLPYVDNDGSRWIPAPQDLEMFDSLKRRHYRADGKIRICHSPTRRDYKGTAFVEAAVEQLKREGFNVELVLVEKMTYEECLRKKATCDITYDQMHLCYGNSGLEGMAFGQAVVVGMPEWTRGIIRDVVGYEPYAFAEPETLTDVLRDLVADTALRKASGEISRKYIEDFHEHSKVAHRVVGLYERIPG